MAAIPSRANIVNARFSVGVRWVIRGMQKWPDENCDEQAPAPGHSDRHDWPGAAISSFPSKILQLAGDRGEHAAQIAADRAHDGDGGNRNQSGN